MDTPARAFPGKNAPVVSSVSAGPIELRGYQGELNINEGNGWYVIRQPSVTERLTEAWIPSEYISASDMYCSNLEYRPLTLFAKTQLERRLPEANMSLSFDDSFDRSISWFQIIDDGKTDLAHVTRGILPFKRLIAENPNQNPVITLHNEELTDGDFGQLTDIAVFLNLDHVFPYSYPGSYFAIRFLRSGNTYHEIRIYNNCTVDYRMIKNLYPEGQPFLVGEPFCTRETDELFIELYLVDDFLRLYINDVPIVMPEIDRSFVSSGYVEFAYSGLGSLDSEPASGIHYIVVLGNSDN